MWGNFRNVQLDKQKLLLTSIKNIAGDCLLDNVDRKITDLVTSVVLDEIACDAVSIETLRATVNSLKLIFELVEASDTKIELKTGVDETLQFIRDILDLKIEHLVVDCLNVVRVVCKICAKRIDVDLTRSLSKFYLYNLYLVSSDSEQELRLRLRVLSEIFHQLKNSGDQVFLKTFKEECRHESDFVVESKLLTRLILKSCDLISAQALLTVFPGFVQLFDANDALLTVWNASLDEDPAGGVGQRFSSLCSLFEIFASAETPDGGETFARLLQNEQFWLRIQSGLTHADCIVRRQALFLLKRSIEELSARNLNLVSYKLHEIGGKNLFEKFDRGQIKLCNGMKNVAVCNGKMFLISNANENDGDCVMWWDGNLNQELGNLFSDVFLLLETLEEKQSHIVKPILGTMIRLLGPAVCPFRNGKRLHISWILALFQRILEHDNATIVRWGLIHLMEIDLSFYSSPLIMKKIVQLFTRHINCLSVFATEFDLLRNEMNKYLTGIAEASSEISVAYFKELITEMCEANNWRKWSSEPLFLLLDSLQQIKLATLTSAHLGLLKQFVATSIATQYTFLRAAIQCNLITIIMNLTDVGEISLEILSDTLSVFRRRECLERGSQIWQDLTKWIAFSFSKRNAQDYILRNVPRVEENAKKIAQMTCLLYDAHLFGIMKCCGEAPSCQIIATLMDTFKSFQDADKRLLASNLRLFHNLNIIRGILKENVSVKSPQRSQLVKVILPEFGDIVAFIASRSCGLDDYETAVMFVDVFELMIVAQKIYGIHATSYVNGIYESSLRSLGVIGEPSTYLLDTYVSIHYLQTILNSVYRETTIPHLKLLQTFFQKHVNKPLKKPGNDQHQLALAWGRINTSYLTSQWRIINRLKSENLLTMITLGATKIRVKLFFAPAELCDHAIDGVALGGASLLDAVLDVAHDLLPELSQDLREKLVDACWTAVREMRRSDAFLPSARRFISVVFQPELLRSDSCQQLLITHSSSLLSDSINGLANALMTHTQSLKIKYTSCELWVELLASATVFGPVNRRDDRLTYQVSSIIASTNNSANELVNNDWTSSSQIRARALQLILTATPTLAESLVKKLLEKDEEMMKNKSKQFSGSVSCFVRSRILQTLNVLEPLLSKDTLEHLYAWACKLLLRDGQQPLARYLTEWLIVRILCKNYQLLNNLWLNFTEALEQRVGSLCSFISIVYHVSRVLPDDLIESWLDKAIMQLIPYCLSQHFTLRLYAQVAIDKMWHICETKGLKNLLTKYQIMRECQLRAIGAGNSIRNAEKLAQDFYWTVFHAIDHYALVTIYRDLPRLAHIKTDEWITPQLMLKVGITSDNTFVPFGPDNDENNELWQHAIATWTVQSVEETNIEIISENMQKKLIPMKSLLPDYDQLMLSSTDDALFSRKKSANADGLIVVASLIDRAANLGGLSRTCEAFGVSELIISSLKILEDKQFQSLSVTAEKWLTITEIKCQHLSDYLLHMKKQGYAIIGAEQTTHSQSLNQAKMPRKSMLLLGSEKEGVPPQLLPLMDVCIQVPQMGVVRSLNVHVTAALFVWEYTKQHTLQ